MLPVVTAAEMRELDRATMEEVGITGFTLMETAGRAVADAAMTMVGRGPVAVVCGPGNNGGDGFVVARVLRNRGIDATVYLAAKRDAIKGYARTHLEVLERSNGVVTDASNLDAIAAADLAIDGLFGIGLVRPLDGALAQLVGAINAARRRLAIDIPSGLSTDTGQTLGAAVDAHKTITMGALKIALASAPGFARCGEVVTADIGIPRALVESHARAGLVEDGDIARWLPRAGALDHKGRRGHVIVIGGANEMRGARRMAAIATLRAGAGLVTLAGDGTVDAPDAVMTRALRGAIGDALDGKDAVVIGPGLGRDADARARVLEVLGAGVPAVLDADGLTVLADAPEAIAAAAGPVVITPHPGEAARLLATTAAAIEADRLAAARALAGKTRAVVVLKGARTIVCDGTLGDEYCAINPTGSPALATGGTGDVLAGTIGALLAQGLEPALAARAGVFVHGRAGERLAVAHGPRGALASDLPVAIAGVVRDLVAS